MGPRKVFRGLRALRLPGQYAGRTGRHFSGGLLNTYLCQYGSSTLRVRACDRDSALDAALQSWARSHPRGIPRGNVLVLNLSALEVPQEQEGSRGSAPS